MIFTSHRVNSIAALKQTPKCCGVEVDLRDGVNDVILAHDPFDLGEAFEDYLDYFAHEFIILNIKSERIEGRVLELIRSKGVNNFFFLDSSFPMIYAMTNQGVRDIALRMSELEPIEMVLKMSGRISWVWVDCFSRNPLSLDDFLRLKESGLRVCLVSPELQGRPNDTEAYVEDVRKRGYVPDMVCSKNEKMEIWKSLCS